ncbi:hypothetical protein IHE45_04G082600 [Dioscorea alata]|uniref:Uncharacterized protein n=1 Tax=Dioscorea alata TaxID=55571 RepID=A0ACB7WEH4_DIOAL|nr:hypothetical protein IHE45_04G082600 [Dioscorea alata]
MDCSSRSTTITITMPSLPSYKQQHQTLEIKKVIQVYIYIHIYFSCTCVGVCMYNTKNMFKFRERKTSVLDEHVSVCVCKRDISEREGKKERGI